MSSNTCGGDKSPDSPNSLTGSVGFFTATALLSSSITFSNEPLNVRSTTSSVTVDVAVRDV